MTPPRPARLAVFACAFAIAPAVSAACNEAELAQGEPYAPSATLATGPGQPRPPPCEAGCEAEASPSVPDADPDVVGVSPSNTCTTAKVLGSVSGDTAADVISANGTCSEWLRVRVTENDTSVIGAKLELTLTLTPTGQDFDLLAYLDTAVDRLSCIAPLTRSEKPGTAVESITLSWGEGGTANNADDSRDVSILVLAKEPCVPGSTWALRVRGNP